MGALTLDDLGGIRKAGLHVLGRQFRVSREKTIQVGVVGKVGQDALDRYPCPLDHGFPCHDLRALRDAVYSGRCFFLRHVCVLKA